METALIQSRPDTLGGTACFAGTRVPVKSLFYYLEAGDGLEEFIEQFPSVSHDQAVAVFLKRPAYL